MNVTYVNLCEADSVRAYSDCNRHATFDSLCSTKRELGHWDTILQSQTEVVHLTNMDDFVSSVWCDNRIPIDVYQYQTYLQSAKVWGHGLHMTYMRGIPRPRPMTDEELSIAISQANSWTSASWSMIPDVVRVTLARLDDREGAAEAQLTLHAALQDEPRICSSCRKEKLAADYSKA